MYDYQKIIVDSFETNYNPKKIYYFTYGAGQHFENKYSFSNLEAQKADFSILAEWHFHTTAHRTGDFVSA